MRDAAGSDHGMLQNWLRDKRGAFAGGIVEVILLESSARNIVNDAALPSEACAARHSHYARNEAAMATEQQRHIVETPTEARQAGPGPSLLALLAVSTGLAILILGIVWFVFFRT
jgi:hypothetical protein